MKLMSVAPNKKLSVAQLIDANLDRAREGLRVVEDWCRYGIENKDIVIQLKDFRQQLGRHHQYRYKQARSITSDQGIGLQHPEQKTRVKPEQVVAANCARIQESLRVLEEFSRIDNPQLANDASNIRYKIYDLEVCIIKATIGFQRRKRLNSARICLITSSENENIPKINAALKAGVKMIQYRSKDSTDLENFRKASEISTLCKRNEALFIINDRIDIAIAVEADGVHLGQEDLPLKIARQMIGFNHLIGISTHSTKEIKNAQLSDADYLGVGPIYKTSSKPNLDPLGITYVEEAAKNATLPWFAIGGINSSNLKEILDAGAKKIAVVGAIMNSTSPKHASEKLLEMMK